MKRNYKTYWDKNHKFNSSKYHTGKKCIEKGCDKPAGTIWSPYWCYKHNAKRLERVAKQLDILNKK